jgi:hypothetical protein
MAAGATEDEIADVLLAIAPVTGLGRIAAAAPDVAIALGYDVAAALEELDPIVLREEQGGRPKMTTCSLSLRCCTHSRRWVQPFGRQVLRGTGLMRLPRCISGSRQGKPANVAGNA